MTSNRKRLTPLLAVTAALAVGLSAAAFADPSEPTAAPAAGLTAEQRADIETRFASLGATAPVGDTGAAAAESGATAAAGRLAFS
ncbi:MAG TPA: hypothetical protein VGF17_02000, partial [Phytomonospora sp.]